MQCRHFVFIIRHEGRFVLSVVCLSLPHCTYWSYCGRIVFGMKYVLIFSFVFIWNISYSMINSARYFYKRAGVFIQGALCFWSITGDLEFSQHILREVPNIKRN